MNQPGPVPGKVSWALGLCCLGTPVGSLCISGSVLGKGRSPHPNSFCKKANAMFINGWRLASLSKLWKEISCQNIQTWKACLLRLVVTRGWSSLTFTWRVWLLIKISCNLQPAHWLTVLMKSTSLLLVAEGRRAMFIVLGRRRSSLGSTFALSTPSSYQQ